jgi:hypothetical protein
MNEYAKALRRAQMVDITIDWRKGVNWPKHGEAVVSYYEQRPALKYGPGKDDKAFELIGDLCTRGVATRKDLMDRHQISPDGVATILSNVTMAIQGSDEVWAPENGGWYATIVNPRTYVLCPGFAEAWLKSD